MLEVDTTEEATGEGTTSERATAARSDDMLQTEEMASVGLAVNTRARVVLCLESRQTVKPKHLFNHVRRHSGVTLPLHACHDIFETHVMLPDHGRPLMSG